MKIKLYAFSSVVAALIVLSFYFDLNNVSQAKNQQVDYSKPQNARKINPLTQHALLIQVSDYEEKSLNLSYPQEEVDQIEKVLIDKYDISPKNIQVLRNPGRKSILAAFEQYERSLTERDSILIFYSGNWYWDKKLKQGFWYPQDASLISRTNWISDYEVYSFLKRLNSKHALLLTAAPFTEKLIVQSSNAGRISEEKNLALNFDKTVRCVITSNLQNAPGNSDIGNEVVGILKNNNDLYLTSRSLFEKLKLKIFSSRQSAAELRYGCINDGNRGGGDFVFSSHKISTDNIAVTSFEYSEEDFWLAVSKSDNPIFLRLFLNAFPDGAYAGLARQTLAIHEDFPESPAPANRKINRIKRKFITAEIVENILKKREVETEIYVDDLGNNIKFELVTVPGGTFKQGMNKMDVEDFIQNCSANLDNNRCKEISETIEKQREVMVDGFMIGIHEITQRQWVAVMGRLPLSLDYHPSNLIGEDLPIFGVSWNDVQIFLKRLGNGYRLPNQMEWEYAARAGSSTQYAYGKQLLPVVANYNTKRKGDEVKTNNLLYPPGKLGIANAWGLFDVHGNIPEYCSERFVREECFVCGGSFQLGPAFSMVSLQLPTKIQERTPPIGFRIAKSVRNSSQN